MTTPLMKRASYQAQSTRMTILARKVMYNEMKRIIARQMSNLQKKSQ